MRPTLLMLAVTALGLPGCEVRKPEAGNITAATDATGTVVREAPAPAETPGFQQVQSTVIQSQPGPGGSRVDLTRVAVTGDVLTVQLAISHPTGASVRMPLEEISVVDDTTAQRYSVLKDGGGKWMAAPLGSNDSVTTYISKDAPEIYWFKFPAPPATSKSISINLPGVGPFDGLPVTRG